MYILTVCNITYIPNIYISDKRDFVFDMISTNQSEELLESDNDDYALNNVKILQGKNDFVILIVLII